MISFEDLWNKCEGFQKDASANTQVQQITDELVLKINLYKVIDAKQEIPEEERQKVKSRILGEILLAITCLSFKDNINIYESLSLALQYRSIDHYDKKYPI
jgi:hypothetical protein